MHAYCNDDLPMRQRGVTLLELLIVLALLLAMAVAVGPTVLTTLDERTFDVTMDVTSRQMLLARAHAQARGTPVEVVYESDERSRPWIFARFLTVDENEPRDEILADWARRKLPDGFAITDEAPQPDAADVATTFGEMGMAPTESNILRLGVFLPDGSAMPTADRWLSDDSGRAARMTLNPLTGHVQFSRLPPEDLQSPEQESEREGEAMMQWDEP